MYNVVHTGTLVTNEFEQRLVGMARTIVAQEESLHGSRHVQVFYFMVVVQVTSHGALQLKAQE